MLPLVFGEAAVEEISLAHPSGARRATCEREAFGFDHARAGAMYVARSSVHEDVYSAIAFHHGGATGTELPSPEAACVLVADQVVHMITGAEPDSDLLEAGLTLLGLPASLLDDLAELAAPQPAPLVSPLTTRVQELERIAFVDSLTGINSRRNWLQNVQARLTSDAADSLLICDVGHLKQVNDTHDHAAGDVVLIETARVLARRGFAGRLGGDEFALWIDCGPAEAKRVAAAIVEDLAVCLAGTAAASESSSVSIGIAEAPRHSTDVSSLLSVADAALYAAKAAGRRSVRLAA